MVEFLFRGSKSRYSYKNIAEVMDRFALVKELIIPVLGFVTIFTSSKEVSSVLILISAYQFMMNMSRIPRVGSHVFITGRVFTTIFEFFCSYIVVILGYAVSFHILLPEEVAFSNLGDSFIKVLTMLLGEFDYVDHIASTESGIILPVQN
ncbi:transient receptor potential cation channel subfamily A member 1 homolog [Eurytemora carolleeae]|uniref:transient receptor potential cation channel subfamily A member 1 homolog n=1 Tax=Eurytemora carolleeae TaxID=1294199 RepID=UPI000C78057B|nr:transient receptor potential cation channel subfamily A member 1 homolog [Eurytemora carolleeae]|eukprot:XP_023349744.1 transient receptor potential cation channel subfamily A member 1 homolog [Eurytemora affinis]